MPTDCSQAQLSQDKCHHSHSLGQLTSILPVIYRYRRFSQPENIIDGGYCIYYSELRKSQLQGGMKVIGRGVHKSILWYGVKVFMYEVRSIWDPPDPDCAVLSCLVQSIKAVCEKGYATGAIEYNSHAPQSTEITCREVGRREQCGKPVIYTGVNNHGDISLKEPAYRFNIHFKGLWKEEYVLCCVWVVVYNVVIAIYLSIK